MTTEEMIFRDRKRSTYKTYLKHVAKSKFHFGLVVKVEVGNISTEKKRLSFS